MVSGDFDVKMNYAAQQWAWDAIVSQYEAVYLSLLK